VLIELLLHRLHLLQCLVPSAFELIGHQAVLWIGSIELLLGTAGSVLGGFEVALESRDDLILFLSLLFARQDGCLYRCGLHDTQHLAPNDFIGGDATEGDASGLTVVQKSALARVSQRVVAAAGIAHRQLMTAPPATQESGQKCLSIASRTQQLATQQVVLNQLLDLLKALPAHISFMCVRDERQPLLTGLSAISGSR
jgi:hypothetical protein